MPKEGCQLRAWQKAKRLGKLLHGNCLPESSPPRECKFSVTASHLTPTSANKGVITGFTTGTGTGTASLSDEDGDDRDVSKFYNYYLLLDIYTNNIFKRQ